MTQDRSYRLPHGPRRGFRRPRAGVDGPAHHRGEASWNANPGMRAEASANAVSPAISQPVSPANGREESTTETQGSKRCNQSGSESGTTKPNCYACIHRRGVPGSAHSSCHHPAVAALHNNPLAEVLGMLGKRGPLAGQEVEPNPLNVKGNPHGIQHGWFIWPLNFDPVWLEHCDGFEPKGGGGDAA